nr:unnamed protein product [Callosobruchus analis]
MIAPQGPTRASVLFSFHKKHIHRWQHRRYVKYRGLTPHILKNLNTYVVAKFVAFIKDIVRVPSVETESVSASLASRNPGKLSHARWLTTTNWITRLYVATEVPDESLCMLVEYIKVKLRPSYVEGTRHLFQLKKSYRLLPEKNQKNIYSVIQRNGIFAHPKNILLSMLTDEDPKYGELAIRRTLKARNKNRQAIPEFSIPVIRFDAKHYTDLNRSNFPFLPCNSQVVRLVTEASAAVCGQNSCDGFNKNRVQSRRTLATHILNFITLPSSNSLYLGALVLQSRQLLAKQSTLYRSQHKSASRFW